MVIGSARQLLSAGYNGFPRGVSDDIDERHERPQKYKWTEHAERNAIYNAAREGVSLYRSVMYVPLFPCADCARAIIQAGIAVIVVPQADDFNCDNPGRWAEDWEIAQVMLLEAGVQIHVAKPLAEPSGS